MGPGSSRKHSYGRVLSNRPMFLLWLGQSVSNSGDSIFAIAIFWFALVTTNSALYVGILSGAIYVSQLLFGTIGGIYVDRFNRRNVLVVANLLQGLLTASISILYVEHALGFPVLVMAGSTIFGLTTIIRASVNAIVPAIVAPDDLATANSLLSLTSSFSTFINYSIGGLIVAFVGIAVPIIYDSITFFFATMMVSSIAKSYGSAKAPEFTMSASDQAGFVSHFKEGIIYIKSNRLLWQVIFFGAVVNFFGTAAITLMAPYAEMWLHGGSSTYGFLLGAFSLGGIMASYVFGKLDLRDRVGRTLLFGTAGAGAVVLMMGLTSKAPLALLLSLVFGFLVVFADLPIQVLLQARVPRGLFGRVYTGLTTAASVFQPISSLAGGYSGDALGVGPSFVVFGTFVTLFSLFAYFRLSDLRNASY